MVNRYTHRRMCIYKLARQALKEIYGVLSENL